MITKIKASEMIQRLKEQAKRNKVDTRRTQGYLSSLEGSKTTIVKKIHKQMLKQDHEIITLEELNTILEAYPKPVANEGELKGRGKEVVLNTTVKAIALYFNGLLEFSFIVTDEGISKFTVI